MLYNYVSALSVVYATCFSLQKHLMDRGLVSERFVYSNFCRLRSNNLALLTTRGI